MKRTDYREFRQACARPQRVSWAVAQYEGRRSICPLGWTMNTSISPPMMAISVAPGRFTHGLIDGSGEFVLAWPGEDLAEETLFCGTHSGRDVDKLAETGLAVLPADHVAAPLIEDCVANLECRVRGRLTTGDHTIFAGEVVGVWLSESPGPILCTVDRSSGYRFLLEQAGYRFGVVRP